MHCFYAVSGNIAKPGSLAQCLFWGQERINHNRAKIVKVCKARAGEKDSRIVFEITQDGISPTPHGRKINLKLLKLADIDG